MATKTQPMPKPTREPTHAVQPVQFEINNVAIPIRGTSPLIVHAWSEKAKKEMRDKQEQVAKKGREPRDSRAEYEASIYYRDDGGYGFPSIAFKAAAIRAGKSLGYQMIDLKTWFHIDGELVPIVGEPRQREDMVRVGNGAADLRYRAEFPEWRTALPVTYDAYQISIDQLVALFTKAGFGVGVGDWRPEKDGQFGRFEVMS